MRRVARVLATFVERRWLWLLLAAAVLTAVAVLGATRVEIRTSQDMAISTHSSVYKDYERYEGYFGGDSIIILLAGELDALLSPANLTAAADLQDRLAADRRVKSVISPVTFLEHAARLTQPASPASAPNPEDGRSMLEDSGFVRSVVFAPDGGVNPQLARVIPDDQHVVMVVRLAGGLTVDEQKAVARDVKEMVPQYHFSGARGAGGGHANPYGGGYRSGPAHDGFDGGSGRRLYGRRALPGLPGPLADSFSAAGADGRVVDLRHDGVHRHAHQPGDHGRAPYSDRPGNRLCYSVPQSL